VAKEALETGKQVLSQYGNKHSPQRFTQPQLFAMLVLRQFFRTDYRGIVAILKDHSDLREVLGLKHVPHYGTLYYAARRLEKKGLGKLC
jgi:hypothetical protein